MATKKTIAMLLISLLVIIVACANVGEALSDCAMHCLPGCMKQVPVASIDACGNACEGLFDQLDGDGNPGLGDFS